MSGKRAKIGNFPYRKQNSIAEIVSTMEYFLVAKVGFAACGSCPPLSHSRLLSPALARLGILLALWGIAARQEKCEHSPVPSHSRPSSVAGSLLWAPCFGDSACKKRHTVAFFTALPNELRSSDRKRSLRV